jgi:hypothetical protein
MSIALDLQPYIPGIAFKESYTLQDLISLAVDDCRPAYEIIADPSTYKFETTTIEFEDGTRAVGELVHIAYWSHRRYNIPVWAGFLNDTVSYYYGKPETGVKPVYAPFPHDHMSKISEPVTPFGFVATTNWPKDYDTRVKSKAKARRRLALLVKYAFLLTGRINVINNTVRRNLSIDLVDLCIVMQVNKNIDGDGAPASRPEDEEDNGVVDSMEVETFRGTNRSASGSAGSTSSTAGIPVRNSKRTAAVTSVSDDEYVEPNAVPNVGHGAYPPPPALETTLTSPKDASSRKRRRSSRWQTGIFPSALDSSEAAEPSKKMKELLVGIEEQCKTELLDKWAREEQASEEKIEELELQVAEEKEEKEE